MDNWDDDGFEPAAPKVGVTDKWEGEDEEEDLKDNWDDEDEEETPKPVEAPAPEPKKGGKRYLQQKLKEKELERQKLAEKRMEEEMNKTPEEKMQEQLLAQKLAEESDLAVTQEMFSAQELDPEKLTLDNFKPRTKENFIEFTKLLNEKLTTVEDSPHYMYLMEKVIESATVNLEPEQLKKLATSLNAIATEKIKQGKNKKGAKKGQKVKLGGGMKATRNDAMDDFSQYNDFDDFI
ncbi:eukaryotic translation initiation factor 3 subunit J-like [Clavelina lepadiformis]|uniref:eukaryotic translation initiation factor 3 subunit J-like n=1 Tax=Clavelina lepadiformis TaxID=159417 RepID=UPI004041406F